jgi:peptidoglycan hydrolase-like protein with peptidoglycan-binding domain
MRKELVIKLAKGAAQTSVAWLGIAALAAVVAATPADAKKKKPAAEESPIANVDLSEPMILVVSTGQQKIDIYRGTKLLTTSSVSTGTAAHPTMIGAFSIIEKQRYHHSNLYSDAPMPWMNRITWSGTALHAGVVPGYPASHGCIRLLYSFAPKLFSMTAVGDNVIVSKGRPVPTLVSHPALFQPIPLSKVAEQTLPLSTGGAPLPARAAQAASPVILAKVDQQDANDAKADIVPAVDTANDAAASESPTHARPEIAADPYRTHAITPDGNGAVSTAVVKAEPSPAPASKDAPDAAKGTSAAPAQTKEQAKGPETNGASDMTAAKVDAGTGAAATQAASSEAAAKLEAGTLAATVQAAEPRSEAPLRILFTRASKRVRIIGMQQTLADLGYLDQRSFDGSLGGATVKAIKAFQKDNGLTETGAFDDEIVKKIYEKAGKSAPPVGHLFVRQDYASLFDVPVDFRDPDQPLGTHVYTALNFGPKDTKAEWVTVDVQDDKGPHPLDRIQIPDDVRHKISERLTPGSTFIVGDTAINTANLAKGPRRVPAGRRNCGCRASHNRQRHSCGYRPCAASCSPSAHPRSRRSS